MSFYKIEDSILTSIADAIRSQNGTTAPILTTDFASEILSISTGSPIFKTVMETAPAGTVDVIDNELSNIKAYGFYSDQALRNIQFNNVETIGSYCFYACNSISTASFPQCTTINGSAFYGARVRNFVGDNLSVIGYSAFQNCERLSSINLANVGTISGNAFRSCTSLSTINIENVKNLGEYAFANCSSLTSVTLNNLSSCGSYVFTLCNSLTEVNCGPNTTTIGRYAFASCGYLSSVTIEGIAKIHPGAFYRCSRLTEFSASQIISIGSHAFEGCSALQTISLPNCTSFFDDGTGGYTTSYFTSCINLSSIYLPNLETIAGSEAFRDTALTEIDLPKLKSLPGYTFAGSTNLSYISIPECTYIAERAFGTCKSMPYLSAPKVSVFGPNIFGSNSSAIISEIYAPQVISIEASAFVGCPSLKRFVAGPSLLKIGSYAFQNLVNLSEIVDLSYVQSIYTSTFIGCTGLSGAFDFPNLTLLSAQAFANCVNIQQVNIPTSAVPGSSCFKGCTLLNTVSIGGSILYTGVFQSCSNLMSLYLLNESMVVINNAVPSIFAGSPLQVGGLIPDGETTPIYGSIYVPAELYDTYVNNAKWKVIETSHPGTFVSIIT